jgi:hypothetical protein
MTNTPDGLSPVPPPDDGAGEAGSPITGPDDLLAYFRRRLAIAQEHHDEACRNADDDRLAVRAVRDSWHHAVQTASRGYDLPALAEALEAAARVMDEAAKDARHAVKAAARVGGVS